MVAIDRLFGTRWKKSMLCIFGLGMPKFGDSKSGTKTETVTMARNAHSKGAEDKVLWAGGREVIVEKELK